MAEGQGDIFQRGTKFYRDRWQMAVGDRDVFPGLYKSYPDSVVIKLPATGAVADMPLNEALRRRRSIRRFTGHPVDSGQLSYLLWAATGIQRVEDGYEYRTTPSAGALYPIETYVVVNNVEGISQGIYHYAIREHLLEEIKSGDYSRAIASAALEQSMCAEAAVVFIWTAVFARSRCKYGQRAYRYIYLDAGHIGQILALAAVSIGLGSCPVAALYDDEVNRLVDVDGIEESAIYMSVVGHPR